MDLSRQLNPVDGEERNRSNDNLAMGEIASSQTSFTEPSSSASSIHDVAMTETAPPLAASEAEQQAVGVTPVTQRPISIVDPSASNLGSEESGSGPGNPTQQGVGSMPAKLRKRTKTGCLTCRKRRIKCGEERPTCANCIKSKRHCEGYNQRIVFKSSNGFQMMSGVTTHMIPYHTSSMPGHPHTHQPLHSPTGPAFYGPPHLFPHHQQQQLYYGIPIDENRRPMEISGQHVGPPLPHTRGQQQYPLPPFSPDQAHFPQDHAVSHQGYPPHSGAGGPPPPYSTTSARPSHNFGHEASIQPLSGGVGHSHQYEIPHRPSSKMRSAKVNFGSRHSQEQRYDPSLSSSRNYEEVIHPSNPYHHQQQGPPLQPYGGPVERPHNSTYASSQTSRGAPPTVPATQPLSPTSGNARTFPEQRQSLPAIATAHTHNEIRTSCSLQSSTTPRLGQHGRPYDLDRAAVEFHYDPSNSIYHSEEEYIGGGDLDAEISPQEAYAKFEGEFELINNIYSKNAAATGAEPRDYNNLIHSGILEHYDAEKVASPLRNEHTARVFMHFMTATAMSVSLFEKLPRNVKMSREGNSLIGEPLKNRGGNTREAVWTYVLPMMALNHQGLLHAMLSISSLHISKLQGTSSTPAYKHYVYSCKRIHNIVANPSRRLQASTVAATMLLAYYELMNCDHPRFAAHLAAGARLISEIDFRRMVGIARARHVEAAAREAIGGYAEPPGYENPTLVDQDLVSSLIGAPFSYDQYNAESKDWDPQKYQLFTDLYWWMAKHDATYALVSGGQLMLDFSFWRNCPPRAAVGKPTAIYGTHDHVILILGRIIDFGTRDRKRKLKQIEANGGVWLHPNSSPSSQPPKPPADPIARPYNSSSQDAYPDPTFFGSAPLPTEVPIPKAYADHLLPQPHALPQQSPPKPPVGLTENEELQWQYREAVSEWNRMYDALCDLENHFGSSFEPLPSDILHSAHVTSCPFGQTLTYSSYDIACIWALYYATHLTALRCHPDQSPYMIIAAQAAASKTYKYAELIGRIAAGMMPYEVVHPLAPTHGALLVEMAVPLVLAGIQFRYSAQRDFVVRRLRELEKMTGWSSLGIMALGCENHWKDAAARGTAPEYVAREERQASTPRMGEPMTGVTVTG